MCVSVHSAAGLRAASNLYFVQERQGKESFGFIGIVYNKLLNFISVIHLQ